MSDRNTAIARKQILLTGNKKYSENITGLIVET